MALFKDLGFKKRLDNTIVSPDANKFNGYDFTEFTDHIQNGWTPIQLQEDVDGTINISGDSFSNISSVTIGDNSTSTQVIPDASSYTTYDGYDFSNDFVLTYNVTHTGFSQYTGHLYMYGTADGYDDAFSVNRYAINRKIQLNTYSYARGSHFAESISGPEMIENVTYNVQIVYKNSNLHLFVDDVYYGSTKNSWYFNNNETIRWAGYDGSSLNYLFYGTMNNGKVLSNFTLSNNNVAPSVTQEQDQGNWVQYKAEATNIDGDLYINDMLQIVESVNGSVTTYTTQTTDTDQLTVSTDGTVDSVDINVWTNEA